MLALGQNNKHKNKKEKKTKNDIEKSIKEKRNNYPT